MTESEGGVVTCAVSAEVFSYVMTTAGLLEEDIEWLRSARISSMLGVQIMGRREWQGLRDDVEPIVMATLQSVYDWLVWYGSEHDGYLPRSLEEWRSAFTDQYIMDISRPVNKPSSDDTVGSEKPRNPR